jgi:hypothetical protein
MGKLLEVTPPDVRYFLENEGIWAFSANYRTFYGVIWPVCAVYPQIAGI